MYDDCCCFQNTVIGYFDFHSSPQPPGFHQFYLAALRVISYGTGFYWFTWFNLVFS